MIISRTPFRISFFGGGTDYPAWYRKHGGAVLATSINKYCYLTVRYLPPFFEHRFRVVYSKIEDCLSGHPAVGVAAVIGVPDPVRTERIVAYVVAAPGAAEDDETAAALIAHVRLRLSPHMAPSEVRYVDDIPMTATGKIMRRELRGR